METLQAGDCPAALEAADVVLCAWRQSHRARAVQRLLKNASIFDLLGGPKGRTIARPSATEFLSLIFDPLAVNTNVDDADSAHNSADGTA
jgi:hypothetical protein